MIWAVISTWQMSYEGNVKAAEMLARGCKACDAVVEGASIVEDDPTRCSVGFSGLPDRDGHVTLDGGFMDGDTLKFGAVGCIEGFRSPIRIARKLSECEDSNFLVGEGAQQFARNNGFEERNNLTAESYQKYLAAKDKIRKLTSYDGHDTVCYIAKDSHNSICTAVSTSGLFMKHHGRLGDSPVAGSGYYADSNSGGAAATGVGEDIIKGVLSFKAVYKMSLGKSAMEAAQETLDEFVGRIEDCRHISLIVLDKEGTFGVATNCTFPFVYASDECEPTLYLAKCVDGKTDIKEIPLDSEGLPD
ncbi:MAG: N(4)-(beta-N-acetylglucosaminyl)-L-asparaginase [Erysipelotrichaceae bacterium]|nr:N(4)-(beta-N-acetylglucosaminyl)-L-asparaginase [Erysipelotrichaceae bacterium]